jgi:hypothetical protein
LEQNLGQLLTEKAAAVLQSYAAELDERSQSLRDEDGCWLFLAERLREARTLGVEGELRELVRRAAARFSNGCASIRFSKLYDRSGSRCKTILQNSH